MIADDEPLARVKLREFLASENDVKILGEASTGPEAAALANQLRPDVLFLDVRMPGCDGFQVVERLEHDPTVIFTTAHDSYAVAAFQVRALDYLLKPFGQTRFMETLARVRETLADPSRPSSRNRALAALGREKLLEQMFIRAARGIVPVDVADVTRFEAADDYVTVYARGNTLLAAVRMDELESMLDPLKFRRIHRSHIVNLTAVASITSDPSGRLVFAMKDGVRLFASRSRSRELRSHTV